MANAYAPAAQATDAASIPLALTRLYVVNNGTEYELATSGPADASLLLNAEGEFEVDPAGAARVARDSSDGLIVY